MNRTLLDRPPVLELYERHNPAGLDVNDRHRAAALLEQSLGDPDAAQDGALPPPWPFRQAESGDRYEVPELGTSAATSEIGMFPRNPGTPRPSAAFVSPALVGCGPKDRRSIADRLREARGGQVATSKAAFWGMLNEAIKRVLENLTCRKL